MVEPPGQQGLVERLAALEHRIEELSRRGPQAGSPICVVRLGVDVTSWDYESKDVQPVTSWAAATVDPRGMWRLNEGGQTFLRFPFTGRFSITVASKWAIPGAYNPSVPNCVATAILVNGSNAPANGIAEETRYMLPYANTCYTLTCEDRVFTSGDTVKFNFWSRFANVRLLSRTLSGAYTHFVVRYLGPK